MSQVSSIPSQSERSSTPPRAQSRISSAPSLTQSRTPSVPLRAQSQPNEASPIRQYSGSGNLPEPLGSGGGEGPQVNGREHQGLFEQQQAGFRPLNESAEAPEMPQTASNLRQAQASSHNYWRRGQTVEGVNRPELPCEGRPANQGQQPQVCGPDVARPESKGRVTYKPIPEKNLLGSLSTAALIINKMIGTGIFSKPSEILSLTESKGGALFLWVAGGLMTLTG